MNNFYKPTDSKREEFRKYLERAGVMDIITKAFVNLYEEKERPEDPLEYVVKAMGGVLQEDFKKTPVPDEKVQVKEEPVHDIKQEEDTLYFEELEKN